MALSRIFLVPAALLPLLALYLLLDLIKPDLETIEGVREQRHPRPLLAVKLSDPHTSRGLDKPDEESFYQDLQEKLRSVPIVHWWRTRHVKVKSKCDKVPDILSLHYNNKHWQVKDSDNATFYLYAAYLDNRQENNSNIPEDF